MQRHFISIFEGSERCCGVAPNGRCHPVIQPYEAPVVLPLTGRGSFL